MFSDNPDSFREWMLTPPGSMLFVMILSTIVAVITSILTKILVDTEELARKQKQIKAHQEEKQEIIKIAEIDVERYRKRRKKWERRDIMLKKTQQGMALQRLKPTCITFLPMIIVFVILNITFGQLPVAFSPMNASDIPFLSGFISSNTGSTAPAWTKQVYGHKKVITVDNSWIRFTAWYFICSLGINTLMQRALKLQTQASGGMEQMFSGQKAQAMQFPDV